MTASHRRLTEGSGPGPGGSPWRRSLAALLTVPLLLAACGGGGRDPAEMDRYRERLDAIRTHDFFQTTRILDRQGRLLAELAPLGYRTWVPLEQVPRHLRQAVVATEDRTFFLNAGIDRKAFARALVKNGQAGGAVSGASTITMQVVRLVAFDPEERFERSVDRKLREVYLAAEVDETYSKAEILATYLNVAYFGNGAYGIETAALRYFGRHARELDLAQSTLLAGLLQAPATLDPLRNPAGARARQRVVLDAMVETGRLTPVAAELAWTTPLRLVDPPAPPARQGGHVADYVMQVALPRLVGPHLAARGGFTVTTTIDLDLNDRLTALVADQVARLGPARGMQDAALVALHPATGEILAMVGGTNYDDPVDGQVNMAARPRQAGSAFKPIAYAAAIEAGWSPASVLWDLPTTYGGDYRPRNYDGQFRGPIRLRQALGNSLNAAAIDLTASIGLDRVHAMAGRLGIRLDPDPWHHGLALTLGGAEIPLVELTGAFGALANGGRFAEPAAILSVQPMSGEPPLMVHDPRPAQALSPETAYLVSDILSDPDARRPVFDPGPPMSLSRTAAVKTGTTNDLRDTLTVGYTPYLVVGVWTGNSDGRPMNSSATSANTAAPIWNAAMEAIFADAATMQRLGGGRAPGDGFTAPAGIAHRTVCDLNGWLAGGLCRPIDEVFGPASVAGQPACGESLAGEPDALPTGGLMVGRRGPGAEQVRSWVQSRGLAAVFTDCAVASRGP